MIIQDSLRTVRQMPERAMRAPLIRGILATFATMVVLGLSIGALLSSWFSGWTIPFTSIEIGAAGGWLAGAGTLTALLFAFIPAAALAVSFFIDPVADVVEAKYYPDALPQTTRPLSADLAIAAKTAGLALLINIPLIPFYFIFPPLPALVNGYLLGREYFTMAALRQMQPADVKKLRRRASLGIWTAGALLAFMVTIPILNLIAPVFGAGLMTHVFNRARRRAIA